MAYGLMPILPKSAMVKMIEGGWHHKLARIPSKAGIDPAILFLPRLLSGVAVGQDMRAKYLAWRFIEMIQYSMARKARSLSRGYRGSVDGLGLPGQQGPTKASKVTSRLLGNRRRAEGRERISLRQRLRRDRPAAQPTSP